MNLIVSVSSFLVPLIRARKCLLYSGYMGEGLFVIMTYMDSIDCLAFSYVGGSTNGTSGNDLIKEGGGGLIAVELEYRLGIFGMQDCICVPHT